MAAAGGDGGGSGGVGGGGSASRLLPRTSHAPRSSHLARSSLLARSSHLAPVQANRLGAAMALDFGAGFVADLRAAVDAAASAFPRQPLFVYGHSLGGLWGTAGGWGG